MILDSIPKSSRQGGRICRIAINVSGWLRCRPFRGSCCPLHTRRVSATPFMGGSPLLGIRYAVQPSCKAIRRFRAGDFALCGARERCAAPALGQKGRDTYGFPPSLNSYLSLGSLANGPYGPTS